MRFVIARMNHETNTFSPLPAPLTAFQPRWDAEARAAAAGSQTAMGAFLAFAASCGAEAVTPVFATANPSGPVAQEAFEAMSRAIEEAVRQGCDAILLDLHGAMVTERLDDGEGELIARLRRIAPHVPIGVALDLHGNITAKMVENADVLVGFKTYPHVDMRETGEHVVRIMRDMLERDAHPRQALARPPVLAQTLKMNTTVPGAMADAIAAARAAEREHGVQAVTVFGGFPIADIAEAGMSVVVVADNTDIARRTAHRLARSIWKVREDFIYHERPLEESVERAAAAAREGDDRPVLMLDHGDNCMSGGTCDTMDVVAEALRQGLRGILAGPIADRQAVAAARQAGVGAKLSLEIGNRWPLPGIDAGNGAAREPLALEGTVKALGRGDYVISGPTYTGMRCDMGDATVFATGDADILITEEPHEPWDFGVFTCLGLDPLACRFLILKSRMYCRPVFEPVSKAVVECASLGATSSNFGLFAFEKVTRPIYPLDPEMNWTAAG